MNVTPCHSALIVDRDEVILALLSSRLRDEGYSVVTATCGSEALERLQGTTDLSLVLVDMAVAEGEAFRAKLLDNRASISSHVFITASTDAGALPRMVEREAFYWME